ncbi:hypothetical protein EDB19DRAFT_1915218 [Suillus lakei]|nr:hypothetical protein EDB19DRAFT_1915218 [Suillus lakei]
MTTSVDTTAARANAAFRSAADKIAIAMEMASSLSYVFSSFAYLATSVPPMVLSATTELHEHLDSSSCNVVSTPVWSDIRAGDLQCCNSPLYPFTVAYGNPPPPTDATVAGPSGSNTVLTPDVLAGKGKGKERADPPGKPAEQHGHGIDRGKQPRAMSTTHSQSRALKSKQQRATSKAMITSEDERDLDMADIPKQPAARKKSSLPTRLPPALRKTQL